MCTWIERAENALFLATTFQGFTKPAMLKLMDNILYIWLILLIVKIHHNFQSNFSFQNGLGMAYFKK
jgi:hypothetical protein